MIVLPATGVMAGVTGTLKLDLLKPAAVGIVVATLAAGVIQPFILSGLFTVSRAVAFLAHHFLMQSGERVVRVGMIESRRRLERLEISVAMSTIRAELASMHVLMARGTLPPQAEIGPVEILRFDFGAGTGRDVFDSMAFLAGLFAMFSFQGVARFGQMVEVVLIQTPEFESLPVMFRMAARAIRLASRCLVLV